MSDYPLTLASTVANTGVTSTDGARICVPQDTTTEEFKEYLKQYEPDTFEVLSKIDENTSGVQLTEEQREKIMRTPCKCLGAPMIKPSTAKSLWSRFEAWLLKYTSRSHGYTIDKVEDKADTIKHIWDLTTGDNS